MPRDPRAYLKDILDACAAIQAAVEGRSFADYEGNRLVRSAVEREFIIIGEASAALARLAPEQFAGISRARRVRPPGRKIGGLRSAAISLCSPKPLPARRRQAQRHLRAAVGGRPRRG